MRLIFELVRSGRNKQEIIDELFKRKIQTPSEYKAAKGQAMNDLSRCRGIWSHATLRHLLSDERYLGTYIAGKHEVREVGGNRSRLKDKSEWIKIPAHHPAIISKEVFAEVRAQLHRFESVKKNVNAYPLRGKVFYGCCGHAMHRLGRKNHTFSCQYTRVEENAPCHGLHISEADLENALYEALSAQARIILNLEQFLEIPIKGRV